MAFSQGFEQQPIYNPIIPFTGAIFGGLQEGKMVIIQGQVPGHAKRFAVDFQCGSCENPRSDVAFHFNLRYDEGNVVVCNTLERQCWGSEERKQQMPIPCGSYFELIVNVRSYCFQVSVNGQHFLEYNHRLPLSRVDTLKISGDVHVNAITFRSPNNTNPPVTVSNPVVPYDIYMGSLKLQQKVKVIGTVKPTSHRFTINLKTSYGDNVALHIDQRFSENAVVRNSRINQSWGTEERDLPFLPFIPGQTFEMLIVVQSTCYEVSVNGRHLFNFNHRIQPLSKVDQLSITGDISLSLVQY
ncbi:galectin-9-like [Heptranchias perlo]|uniref:galectin-9-like n=1 Tax=Heptranchias perlo TaxID=212740 RepID=UPI003559435A